MATESTTASTAREPELAGQTVVLIGGSAGIGLETAHRARAEGAEVILAARDPERLKRAADDVGARSTAAFDATDEAALKGFFGGLPGPIDHVLVTGPGPGYVPLMEMTASRCSTGTENSSGSHGIQQAFHSPPGEARARCRRHLKDPASPPAKRSEGAPTVRFGFLPGGVLDTVEPQPHLAKHRTRRLDSKGAASWPGEGATSSTSCVCCSCDRSRTRSGRARDPRGRLGPGNAERPGVDLVRFVVRPRRQE